MKSDERTYLGQLGENGNVTRDIQQTSQAIQQSVKKLQKEYENQMRRTSQEEVR